MKEKLSNRIDSRDIAELLRSLQEDQRRLREQLAGVAEDRLKLEIDDIWESLELPTSHWILLMSGIDQEDELVAATELLLWKEFTARGATRVVCIPTSSRMLYRLFAQSFDVDSLPTLLVSDRESMETAVKLSSPILQKLSERRGNLRKLLTEIHTLIEKGVPMKEIAAKLEREKWLDTVKKAYSEAKSFVSITVRAGA